MSRSSLVGRERAKHLITGARSEFIARNRKANIICLTKTAMMVQEISWSKLKSDHHMFTCFFTSFFTKWVFTCIIQSNRFAKVCYGWKEKRFNTGIKYWVEKKNTWEHREHWCIDSLLTDFRNFSSGVEVDEEGKECVEGRFGVEVNFSLLMGKANFTMGGLTNGIFFSSFPKGTARLQLLHHTTTWHVLTS